MKVKRTSLVINPRAGQNVAKLNDVLAILAAAGWKTEIALKEYGGQTMELANDATTAKRDLVIAYGGDGTLNQVVNGVMNAKGHQSVVGVIPGGTANVWAGEIGVPSDPVKAALSLVNSNARRVDVGHVAVDHISFPNVNSAKSDDTTNVFPSPGRVDKEKKVVRKKDKARHHFLLMAGLGIDAAIMSGVSKPLKYRIGPLAVGLSAMKELPTHHPFPIEIRTEQEGKPLWSGEAIQVVIGNTRRYADVAEMTPDAYIDDGVLDICVITGGDPLTTMQQISSLLLRRKPDTMTAEYFRGSCLYITVPTSTPLQLDGSAVKLKDYLNKSEYAILQQLPSESNAVITYRFEAMPGSLDVAVPRTYDDTLFAHDQSVSQAQHQGSGKVHVHATSQKTDEQTDKQRHTEAHESLPLEDEKPVRTDQKEKQVMTQKRPEEQVAAISSGREVTVVGKTPNPEKPNEYIIAGNTIKQTTGEVRPVAVIVDKETHISTDEATLSLDEAVRTIQEGIKLIVEGKKSKRGVIVAKRLVL